MKHRDGCTYYCLRTVDGYTQFVINAEVQQVKEEEVCLANKVTRFKKSYRRRMALEVETVPKRKHKLLHKMLARIRKKLASKKTRREKKQQASRGHVLETSGRACATLDKTGLKKRPYEKPELPEEEIRAAKFAKIKSGTDNPEVRQFQKRGRWGNCLLYHGENASPIGPDIVWAEKQEPCAKAVTKRTIGGLRHLRETMQKLSVVNGVGGRVYVALKQLLEENPKYIERALKKIGSKEETAIDKDICEAAEKQIRKVLEPLSPEFKAPVAKEASPVNLSLLALWVSASKDPDDQPTEWIAEGAPAGLRHPIVDRGIFPTYAEDEDVPEGDPEDLSTPFAEFANYAGVEEDVDVAKEMARILKKEYVLRFATIEEATAYLGEAPVLSKIGVIKKKRGGKVKSRLVVDTKQSLVTLATRKFERSLLPRALDVVHDVLDIMATALKAGLPMELLEFLIADFKDAFFIIPNKKSERKWFAVMYRGEVYIFLRTTQGSRGAPLTWARFIALIARLTQSVIDTTSTRINTYVDDPIIAALAPSAEKDLKFAMILIIWSTLGLPMSLEKAVRGQSVTWTSAIFTPIPEGIIVQIKEAIVVDATETVQKMLTRNTVSLKDLKSLTGKLAHCASLVM